MSHTMRYTALGLASVGLLGGGLSVTAPVYAGGFDDEVDGEECLEDDDDRECRSRTRLFVDDESRRRVDLTADVDFFSRDDRRRSTFGGRFDDLGEVRFQFRDNDDDDDRWRTFAVEEVDEDGEADVRIRVSRRDDISVRAKYDGVDDEIRRSTSREIDLD